MKNIVLVIVLLSSTVPACAGPGQKNAAQGITSPGLEAKVQALLKRMTLEEKIGQLNQYDFARLKSSGNRPSARLIAEIKKGRLGSLLNIYGAGQTKAIQRIAVEQSRLGIPLVFALDVIHGYKTIFPVPLAEAASWDLGAIEKSARTAAVEASAGGIHWTFAPMVDIARDPRWGRIMEGAGEDPYLGSLIAAARVRGFQGKDLSRPDTILACAKHYAAYGAAEAGREYNTVDMSRIRLWQVYLPPFKAAVDAGVATVMNSFNELNGIPASANKYLVTDILKGRWRFAGFTVSDYDSFAELVNHGYARDRKRAAELAMNAACDMDMQSGVYIQYLGELAKQGRISEKQIDDAVARVLRYKFALGLFDEPYRYCSEDREKKLLLSPEHRAAAADMARKSIVLLKNEGNLLPLKKDIKTIAVVGMLADSARDMLGNWHAQGDRKDVITLLQGVNNKLGNNTRILFARGYEGYGRSTAKLIDQAVETASRADVIILTIGENGNMTGECTSRADIGLPKDEPELVKAIARLKIPTVVILMNGRPLTIKYTNDNFPAILETWFLGTEAGSAIADVLFGDYNPSGKLPVTFPLAVGQVPIYYAQKSTGRPLVPKSKNSFVSRYTDVPNAPLYPFGFGLSYTTFEYSDIHLSNNIIKPNKPLQAGVTVTNTGEYPGDEVVQLYIRDLVASVTQPIKRLRGFQKIHLDPGRSKEVSFTLTAADLAFYDANLNLIIEPGRFRLFIGTSSADTKEAELYLE